VQPFGCHLFIPVSGSGYNAPVRKLTIIVTHNLTLVRKDTLRASMWSVSALLLLAGCGGGNGGNPASVAPPTNLIYASPHVFVVSQPVANVTPTVTGSVTSYSVSPALPGGLTLNDSSGVISGTPTTAAPAATYTITAANASGSTTAGVSVTVNDITPSVGYDSASYNFTTGVPAAVTPVASGGAVTGWSISQSLPAGLIFSATDGSISGVPTATSTAATYTITAQNSGGSDTIDLSIAVDSGVLLDLGHSAQVASIRRAGNRVLTIDDEGHWVLWNLASGANLARGDVIRPQYSQQPWADFVELAGATLVLQTPTGLQVRDASDGHVLANIETPVFTIAPPLPWWEISTDGSYIGSGNSNGVTAWTRTGTPLFSRSGNYAPARAFATPTRLRIGAGAAGTDRVETIDISNGTSSTVPFQGEFHSWFVTGDRFLTHVGNTVWAYDADGTQLDLRTLPTIDKLTGQGDWFWTARTAPDRLDIYSVGASATPAASYNLDTLSAVVPSGDTLAILEFDDPELSVVDLSGVAPVKVDHAAPIVSLKAYSSISSTQWLVSNSHGVVAKSGAAPNTPTYYGTGAALSIAAGPERIAVATAFGQILYFDAVTRQQQGSIVFPSFKIELSTDGNVLAALANDLSAQNQLDRSLRIFSLPSQNVLRDEPYTHGTIPWPYDFTLSPSGAVFAKSLNSAAPGQMLDRRVSQVSNGASLWSDSLTYVDTHRLPPVRLSPTDSTIATSDSGSRTVGTATNIVVNGNLASAVSGWALGWLDSNQLLLNRYVSDVHTGGVIYDSSTIVSAAGQQIRLLQLPEMATIQAMPSDRIYSPEHNLILSVIGGETLWESTNRTLGRGAVTATHVIFASGAEVRIEPY
jgi:hypothetical protein